MDASEAVAALIQDETNKLDRFFDRITSCRVMVETPHRHHRNGHRFHIRIQVAVPGKELVVAHEPAQHAEPIADEETLASKRRHVDAPTADIYVAVAEAFAAMRRQLQDYIHTLRGM